MNKRLCFLLQSLLLEAALPIFILAFDLWVLICLSWELLYESAT